jgi:uncharacterized protein (TIGR02588 family)
MKLPMNQSSRRKLRLSAEWITFTINLFLVLVLVGLVLLVWFTADNQPPILSVKGSSIQHLQGQYYVPFTVTNTGGGTAESVQVLGELAIDGRVEETGEQQLDFLSAGEAQEGAFVFSQDPQKGELTIRVASYKLP